MVSDQIKNLKCLVRCVLYILAFPIRLFFTFSLTLCLPLALPIWSICWIIGWSKNENMYGLTPISATRDAYLTIWGRLT